MTRDIGIRRWKLSWSPIMLTDPEILLLFATAVYTHTKKSWFIVHVDGTKIRKCRHSSRWKCHTPLTKSQKSNWVVICAVKLVSFLLVWEKKHHCLRAEVKAENGFWLKDWTETDSDSKKRYICAFIHSLQMYLYRVTNDSNPVV